MVDKSWAWGNDGRDLDVDGKKFQILEERLGAVSRTVQRYVDVLDVAGVLTRSRRAFEEGDANFENAADKLLVLGREYAKAMRRVTEAAREFEKFFAPPGILKAIPDDQQLVSFIRDAMDLLPRLADAAQARSAMSEAAARTAAPGPDSAPVQTDASAK